MADADVAPEPSSESLQNLQTAFSGYEAAKTAMAKFEEKHYADVKDCFARVESANSDLRQLLSERDAEIAGLREELGNARAELDKLNNNEELVQLRRAVAGIRDTMALVLPPAMIDALPGIGTGVPQQTPSVQTTRHVTIVANGHSASSRPAASSSSSRRADAERAESSTPAPKSRKRKREDTAESATRKRGAGGVRRSASSALNRRPKSHQPSSPHSSLTELADHDHHDHDESGSDSNSNSSSSQEENSYYSSSDESESTPDEEDQYDPSSVGRYRTRRQPLPKRKDLSGSVYLPTKRTSRPPTKTKATTAAQWVGLPGDDEEVVRKVREQAGTQTIRDEEGEGSAGVLLVEPCARCGHANKKFYRPCRTQGPDKSTLQCGFCSRRHQRCSLMGPHEVKPRGKSVAKSNAGGKAGGSQASRARGKATTAKANKGKTSTSASAGVDGEDAGTSTPGMTEQTAPNGPSSSSTAHPPLVDAGSGSTNPSAESQDMVMHSSPAGALASGSGLGESSTSHPHPQHSAGGSSAPEQYVQTHPSATNGNRGGKSASSSPGNAMSNPPGATSMNTQAETSANPPPAATAATTSNSPSSTSNARAATSNPPATGSNTSPTTVAGSKSNLNPTSASSNLNSTSTTQNTGSTTPKHHHVSGKTLPGATTSHHPYSHSALQPQNRHTSQPQSHSQPQSQSHSHPYPKTSQGYPQYPPSSQIYPPTSQSYYPQTTPVQDQAYTPPYDTNGNGHENGNGHGNGNGSTYAGYHPGHPEYAGGYGQAGYAAQHPPSQTQSQVQEAQAHSQQSHPHPRHQSQSQPQKRTNRTQLLAHGQQAQSKSRSKTPEIGVGGQQGDGSQRVGSTKNVNGAGSVSEEGKEAGEQKRSSATPPTTTKRGISTLNGPYWSRG